MTATHDSPSSLVATAALGARWHPAGNAPGLALLLVVWCGGAAAAGWAGWQLLQEPASVLGCTALAALLTALVAGFPVRIVGTRYVISAADVVVFTALAALGPEAAIVCAGVEGMAGGLRLPQWMSVFRLVTVPSLLMAVKALVAGVFLQGQASLLAAGWAHGPALLAALGVAAAVNAAASVTLGTWVGRVSLGLALPWQRCITGITMLLSVMLPSALVAGLVQLSAAALGRGSLVVSGSLATSVLVLLQMVMRRLGADHAAQHARLLAARHDAAAQRQRFEAAFRHAGVGMLVVGPDGTVAQANRVVQVLTGEPEARLRGRPLHELVDAPDAERLALQAAELLAGRAEAFSLAVRLAGAGATAPRVQLHCGALARAGDGGAGLVCQLLPAPPHAA